MKPQSDLSFNTRGNNNKKKQAEKDIHALES